MTISVAKGRRLMELKAEKERTAKAAEAAERTYRSAESDFWMDLDEEGDLTVKKDLGEPYGVVTFQKRQTITGRILNDEEAEAALAALGEEDAILGPRKPRGKVLNELVRSRLESGQPLPDGIDFNTRRFITATRRGK